MTEKKSDHFNLLCDMDELATLLTKNSDIRNFLQSTVEMISRYLNTDVCSIYLYDEKQRQLVLKATMGLAITAVDQIRMKPGEGLVGATFETLRPIRVPIVRLDPRFKYFKEAKEDRLTSFLSVPIQRGGRKIGVLVLQHENEDYFNRIDMVILRALSSQLAGTVENARMMTDLYYMNPNVSNLSRTSDTPEDIRFVKGESASGGYAYAAAAVFRRSHGTLLGDDVSEPDATYSLEDFYKAVQKTSEQLIDFQARLAEQLLESASLIFDAHFMILKDAKFINKIVRQIMEGISPPEAIKGVTSHYIGMFSSSSNDYIREKVNDMEDLAGRILRNLYNWSSDGEDMGQHRIVIAPELYPSEVLRLASEDVRGIILVSGGVTSHVAILARSLKIPLVIADNPELLSLSEGTRILLDAEIGNIHVRPGKDVVQKLEIRRNTKNTADAEKIVMAPLTRTKEGGRVRLLANINLLSELSVARELKAEGIGLYRTEFPFLIRSAFPSEEEQYLVYKRLFDEMQGQEITIRTLDVGGDKSLSYADSGGPNPELGLRSIRFSLHHRDIFEQQIRAILRAGAKSEKLHIMFPMISSIDEFQEAKQIVGDCIEVLRWEKLPCNTEPAIGIMVEMPSVLEIIHEFARESDFFSIGTNDFVQYMLAVDRSDKKVAGYYRPCHPSVLRGIAKIVNAAISENKSVAICGEMAHEAEYIPFLLGIGVRKFSADPQFLPALQKVISSLNISDAEKHAQMLLTESTIRGTREILYGQTQ